MAAGCYAAGWSFLVLLGFLRGCASRSSGLSMLAVLAALSRLDANDLLRAVDMLDLQPAHLAGTQAAAIAETEENARLEAAGNGQQALRLVRAHHQRNLLWLTDVIDLGGKIQSPQRHAEQEPQPGHDAAGVADARAGHGQVNLERADG